MSAGRVWPFGHINRDDAAAMVVTCAGQECAGSGRPAHRSSIRPPVATARMTSVVPSTVAMWRQPSDAIAVSDVASPSAEMAISSPQFDASISGVLTLANTGATVGKAGAMLLSTQRPTKTSANTGTGMRAAAVATVRRANHQPMTRTSGSISRTRNNLTTTAVLPTASETAYPAPTTCATSWMVAPSRTPVDCGSNPSATHSSG